MSRSLTRALGRYLRDARARVGVSRTAFAHGLRLGPTTYARLEAGERPPRLSTLERLAAGFACSVSELLRRAERERRR